MDEFLKAAGATIISILIMALPALLAISFTLHWHPIFSIGLLVVNLVELYIIITFLNGGNKGE